MERNLGVHLSHGNTTEHERWWTGSGNGWSNSMCSENRLELFKTGHQNEVHLAQKASDSTKLETTHNTPDANAAGNMETLLDCQPLRSAIITPRTKVALTFWMYKRLAHENWPKTPSAKPHTECVWSSPSVKRRVVGHMRVAAMGFRTIALETRTAGNLTNQS